MKIMIAVPTGGDVRVNMVNWLLSFDRMGHECHIMVSELRPIEKNRKHIRQAFLDSGCDYLFQIDSDMQPPKNLLKMVDNKLDVCSADIRTIKGNQVVRLALSEVKPNEYGLATSDKELFECDAVGGGCLLTSRKVMEAIDYNYMSSEIPAEDFDWCKRAKTAGFKIHMDTRYHSVHYTICPL